MNENSKKDIIQNSESGAAEVRQCEQLTREQCLEILGLPENADDNAVKQRYGGLLRQYKRRVDEKGTTYEDLEYYKHITTAYDTIMGFTHDFGDDNPTSPIPYKFRRKWGKLLTFAEQYSLLLIMGAVVICLGIMFVIQATNNKEEDIAIKFVGAYGSLEQQVITEKLNESAESFDNAQVSFFTVTTSTNMLDNAAKTYATTFLSQLMAGALDVVLIDKESFDVYVTEAAFLKLDDLIADYEAEGGDLNHLELYRYGGLEEKGYVIEEGVYGIEVTGSELINAIPEIEWMYDEEAGQEKTMIFTICRSSDSHDVAWEFGKELIETTE